MLSNMTKITLAAPSWVFPGSVAENAEFLSGKVQEVGLLFMESASALAYGPDDLPPALAALPLSWHVHLPSDLNWDRPDKCAEICLALMNKAAFLKAGRAVLHPPPMREQNIDDFMGRLKIFMLHWTKSGRKACDLLLENLPEHKLEQLFQACGTLGASACFDLAHYLLGGGTEAELPPDFTDKVRLLHLCSPAPCGQKGHHHPLGALDDAGSAVGRAICRAAAPGAVFMLELFNWPGIANSLPIVNSWME